MPFYYFGRKKRLANEYPAPEHTQIVEPFAGSAAYSLHGQRWKNDVWINDLDPEIIALWHYLQQTSRETIESLPDLNPGEKLSDHKQLAPEERTLISLHIGPGKNKSNDVVSQFSRWPAGKKYVAQTIHKIKHWKITNLSYSQLPDIEATWFIDPPYQRSGKLYRFNNINFDHLANWSTQRQGLVIVCEQNGADWLPFVPLTSIHIAGKHQSHEQVWVKYPDGSTGGSRPAGSLFPKTT